MFVTYLTKIIYKCIKKIDENEINIGISISV